MAAIQPSPDAFTVICTVFVDDAFVLLLFGVPSAAASAVVDIAPASESTSKRVMIFFIF